MKHKYLLALLLCSLSLPVVAPAAPIQWTVASGGNGHYYDYVPAISIFAGVSFGTARSAAEASSYVGLPGYLATITSAEENDFLASSFSLLYGFGSTTITWFGASDEQTDGVFRWLAGPEVGQPAVYTNFNAGQVDQPGQINYLAMYRFAGQSESNGQWLIYNNGNSALGYFVEYGPESSSGNAVPEPASWALAAGTLALLSFARSRWSRL